MRAAILAAILLMSTLVAFAPDPAAAEDPALVLKVGVQDEMKTRNPLPATANDVWTHDILDRVYDRPLQERPNGTPLAYVAKGVDYDEDGTFEPASEYDMWSEHPNPSSPLNITVYYDFNGVRWHDGVQLDVWDLLFSYHLGAMHPALNASLRVLFAAGAGASYEDGDRQLTVEITAKNWEGEGTIAGDPALRVAVRFRLTEPYARFYERTLAPVLFPMHVWSGMGGGRHADFGCAIYVPTAVAAAKGVPCGSPDPARHGQGVPPTDPLAYRFSDAEGWIPGDGDVIGSGPFRFHSFVPGVEARVLRNDDYYVGGVYDARLARILKLPTIEGIRFLVYKTTQLGVFALQSGEIDYFHWNVGPEFVPDLLKVPEIAVEANAEPGYFYLGYNLRRAPWGYEGNDPARDVGFWLRQALSHLIDKRSIVQNVLQNFGVVMDGFISPANTHWYDDTIPKPSYDLAQARTILDSPEARAAGIGADSPGACSKDTPAGCRSLPGIGTASFEILKPQVNYDPIIPEDPLAMIFDAWRQVGLNAIGKPTAFGEIANRIAAHDFDIYLLSWRIDGTDPDYLFDLFHSSNAAFGLNYGGFRNATFDARIEGSRRELDRDARRSLVWQAHDVLVAARPAEPIYSRMNIEAYRQDRFVNWTVVDGTIWNYWSLIGIRPPRVLGERLHIQLAAASAMYSGSSQFVTATVLDPEGHAVPGATVGLVVDSGTLTAGGATARNVSLTTDINGRAQATLTAPIVEGLTMILLQAGASHPDFNPAPTACALVYVFPPGERFLSVSVELPIGDILGPGDALPVRLDVRDQDGEPMPDAIVNVTTTNETLLRPSRTNGTAADLTSLLVEADASIANATAFALTVRAASPSYYDAETSVPILVIPVARTHRCPTGEIVRDLADCPEVPTVDPVPIVLAAGAAVAAAAIVAFALVRRRRAR